MLQIYIIDKDNEDITSACKAECIKKDYHQIEWIYFHVYLARVKKNMHMVIAMSPIGDAFTTRLRMFPSLVNCCDNRLVYRMARRSIRRCWYRLINRSMNNH